MSLELVRRKGGLLLRHNLIQPFFKPFGDLVSPSEGDFLDRNQRKAGQFGDREVSQLPDNDGLV
jgi:hypothetical protein